MSEQIRSQQMPFRMKEEFTVTSIGEQNDPLACSVLSEPLVAPDPEQLESLAILDRLQARLTVMRHAVRNLVPRKPAE